jgi:hypothetical protein
MARYIRLSFPIWIRQSLYTTIEASKRARWILSLFHKSHKTESSFYLTFCRLDRNDIEFLKSYWKLEDDLTVFIKLCSIYKIKTA